MEPTEQQRKQHTFNKVWAHSAQMTRISSEPGRRNKCLYRAPDGNRCFIGALIPDELYEPEMDHDKENFASGIINRFESVQAYFRQSGYSVKSGFLDDLQGAHDRYFEQRQARLGELAELYQLQIPTE